jgi:hypothetical protein
MDSRNSGVSAPMFIAASFTITGRQKPPTCPSADEWINKIHDMNVQ